MNTAIGKSVRRKDAWDKVTGKALYTDDFPISGVLAARLLTSTCAHARILHIDISKALGIKGVKAVLTGADCPELFGPLLQDRPALARDVVRYAGEPVALVVATDKPTAERAVRLIKVDYEPLAVVLTPSQAMAEGTPLIHKQVNGYKKLLTDIYPEAGTNIASRYRMQKGNTAEAFQRCKVLVEQRFFLPPSAHLAMEVRTARAEISSDGSVLITASSQSPYSVRKQLSEAFLIPAGKIQVRVPYVGGGFGGKAPVMLEVLAFLASRSVGGKAVRLTIPREQDMASAPCRMGLEADLKVGVDENGLIQAADLTYLLDCGAYTDISPYMTKAIAMDCTGPYHIENLSCDAICVYTNHTYVTSFRGFSHESFTFCIERVLDMLASKCSLDPLEFRIRNAIRPGSLTPSQVECTASLTGDLTKCLNNIKQLAQWNGGNAVPIKENTVRAKGVACFWKTENPPTDAISGAMITFNPDGSMNLNTGVVEMGSNGQTHLAQILAEKLQVDADQVHVVTSVDTRTAPEHWKTVASLTEYMAGLAVVRAADDLLEQLRSNGSQVFGCPADEIEVANGRVFSKKNPEQFIAFKDIVQGYKSQQGESIGEPVLGRGGFMLKGLSMLDPQTGQGKTGPEWTLGAQVVEVEADLKAFSYRILNASTVIDVGKVINPESMRAMIAGGMAMGISLSSREAYIYDQDGIPRLPNLRTYKLMHIGQEPDYRVGFVETPEDNSPYGLRSFAEHGVIGIPAALGNALAAAFGRQLVILPLTPETIWRTPSEEHV
ncbi:MAG: xanthine dehydrogenase family protein molybdopterin-binding subunit [Clostridia bacterium]|nr:xanthine dehydrogenase family protein molybdopterin-binding subunit [Clostridia bacterium]MDD4798641.1 xanthine dehydrogenase family protein molybdopterin-binding subunit [Clostridia bacterium]